MFVIPLILLAMLVGCFGIVTGVIAVVTLIQPSKSTRTMGATSIICVVVATLSLWNIAGTILTDGILPVMCLVPGVVAVVFGRTPQRVLTGHCWKCGYNLTGNVSGVCSECGATVPTS